MNEGTQAAVGPGRRNQKLNRVWIWIGLLSLLVSLWPGGTTQVSAAAASTLFSSLDQTLSAMAPESNFLVAEFKGNTCDTIHARNADRELAIASTFKLYVLGELTRQIQLGEASWNERIPLRDDMRSMPSGDYAFAPAGTMVSLKDLAAAMIWNSDNTATDHLIQRLGRDNVQRAFGRYGHGNDALNSPLLLTHEMFAIKMKQPASWMQAYEAANGPERMAMLKRDIDPIRVDPAGGWGQWNGPTAIDGIEWFASASDLCRAMASLWTVGAQPGLSPVRDILSGNRFGVTDTTVWPRAGYKGGFESGVVNMTFVLEREDGRVFFVSAGYNDPAGLVDTATTRSYLDPLFACLGSSAQGSCGH